MSHCSPVRRAVLRGLTCGMLLALGAGAQPAAAAGFPERPVTMIVPWPAGGAADGVLRGLAQATAPFLGQPIVIENKPGVGGTLGPAAMAHTAKPDGYTVAQITIAQFRLPHMQAVNYDPLKDFSYIIGLSGYTFGVVVRADAPWKDWDEFVAYAKANPGRVTYGTGGTGTTHHIAMEAVGEKAGVQWTHIPFKGSADNLTALMGGHIMASVDSTGWAPYVEAGKMRLLITLGSERTKKWPYAPTLLDKGYGLAFDSPYGLAAPAGTPPEVVAKLHDAFKKGLESPEFAKVMEFYDQTNRYMSTADYEKFVVKSVEEEGRMVQRLGLGR